VEDIKRYEIMVISEGWDNYELSIEEEQNKEFFDDDNVWCKSSGVGQLVSDHKAVVETMQKTIDELKIEKIINSVKLILKFKYKLPDDDINAYVDSMYVGGEWMNEIDQDTNIEWWVDELVDCWKSEC
jgi:hypothetical protein